jgi:Rieske Fe-S protein
MATCETCGNAYEDTFQVTMKGLSYDFDSFECAIHALAPACKHCGCRVLGHGVQNDDIVFCCVHCASEAGVKGLIDHTLTE